MTNWKNFERRVADKVGGRRIPITGRKGLDIDHPTLDIEWDEAYKQAMIPEDGTILVRREWVEKKYRVKHDDDGTIRYIPLIEKIEE